MKKKLHLWQERLKQSDAAWSAEVAKMDRREKIYGGRRDLEPVVPQDRKKNGKLETPHRRNLVFELVETRVSTTIPAPKVTPRRKKDEGLADVIEHWLRNELDRMPVEMLNDMAERLVPIQGGVGYLVEWDDTKQTPWTTGELGIQIIHPRQFAPQPGVYTGIEEMDWFIIKMPSTRAAVRQKYGVELKGEWEEEPELRGGEAGHTEDAVTVYMGYERRAGGLDRYVWAAGQELEDLENYQARRQPVCAGCGRPRPLAGQIISRAVSEEPEDEDREREELERAEAGRRLAERLAGELMGLADVEVREPEPERYDGGACPWCGGEKFTDRVQEQERVLVPIRTEGGTYIEGMHPGTDEAGNPVLVPTMLPFYNPGRYPVVLQRSVSVHGQLLGSSDVDMIEDQQNTANRLEKKIIDRILKAGSKITMPPKANVKIDPEDGDVMYLDSPKDRNMIGVQTFSGDLQYEMAYLALVYEEARQTLGVTDSYQGRKDATATSGKAKEFSAAQAAGRMESMRVMKQAAWAALFELMFRYALAYADEPRPVSWRNQKGETQYGEFSRYDFLERDANGNWRWNDQFLFSCDTAAPLAANREAMWQETRMNLQTGAFGNPQALETLILFWGKMEELHYPGAAATKKNLEDRLEEERAAMAAGGPMGGPGFERGMDIPGGENAEPGTDTALL